MSQLTCPKPYKILTIFVCVAAGVIGSFFGLLYEVGMTDNLAVIAGTGIIVAGIGGLLAGFLWSCIMLQRTRQGARGAKLVGKGLLWGIALGVADTLLFHIVVYISIPTAPPDGMSIATIALFIGLIFGILAGAVNGLICGLVWNAVAKKYPLEAAGQG